MAVAARSPSSALIPPGMWADPRGARQRQRELALPGSRGGGPRRREIGQCGVVQAGGRGPRGRAIETAVTRPAGCDPQSRPENEIRTRANEAPMDLIEGHDAEDDRRSHSGGEYQPVSALHSSRRSRVWRRFSVPSDDRRPVSTNTTLAAMYPPSASAPTVVDPDRVVARRARARATAAPPTPTHAARLFRLPLAFTDKTDIQGRGRVARSREAARGRPVARAPGSEPGG